MAPELCSLSSSTSAVLISARSSFVCIQDPFLHQPEMTHIVSSENGVAVADCTEIIAVRHGETSWNSEGRVQGQLDVELNDIGRKQAVAVADRLAKEGKISAIYSSDLKRARETAQIIANRCNFPEVCPRMV